MRHFAFATIENLPFVLQNKVSIQKRNREICHCIVTWNKTFELLICKHFFCWDTYIYIWMVSKNVDTPVIDTITPKNNVYENKISTINRYHENDLTVVEATVSVQCWYRCNNHNIVSYNFVTASCVSGVLLEESYQQIKNSAPKNGRGEWHFLSVLCSTITTVLYSGFYSGQNWHLHVHPRR